ncbi:MAG: hypothetical protein AB1916_03240 [Thermodesulfobacteriota bacterium]
MPEILSHVYDEAAERLEVSFHHPTAGKVVRVYREFGRELYEAWRLGGTLAETLFLSFMDDHDEEHLLHL